MKELNVTDSRVVVAMSGGVDSSVAALLLHEQGVDALGVSMQVWDYRNNGGCKNKATCCSPDDFTDARKVAAAIGIPYYVFDFEHVFRKEVIERFVDSYQKGKTPNPCVDCNSKVKFKELRNRAESLGAKRVATGHYAQIELREDGYHLLRGRDSAKDQSYFLYGLSQAELANTLFPVGHLTKSAVREIARSHGLATAAKPESQDVCFVSGKLDEFLIRIGVPTTSGTFVTRDGHIVGRHEGIHRFTVGQRKGLRIGGSERPLYVLEIIPEKQEIVVGEREDLEKSEFMVHELSWCRPQTTQIAVEGKSHRTFRCIAQLRYRHPGLEVEVSLENDTQARVRFLGEWTTVSPGQAAVFYDLENREVLGGGRIAQEINLERAKPTALRSLVKEPQLQNVINHWE